MINFTLQPSHSLCGGQGGERLPPHMDPFMDLRDSCWALGGNSPKLECEGLAP